MTVWDDRFANHPIHASFDALESSLHSAADKTAEVEGVEARERIARVLDYLRRLVAAADPVLVPTSLLDQLLSDVDAVRTSIDQYVQTEDSGYLNNANANLDAALGRIGLGALLGLGGDDGVVAYRDALVSFRSSASQHLRYLEAEAKDLAKAEAEIRSDVEGQKTEIASQKGRLDSAIAEYQKQFSANEAQRTQTFTQRMDEVKTSIDSAVSDATQSLQAELKNVRQEVRQARSEAEGRLVAVEQGAKEDADELITELGRLKDDAAKVAQFIGAVGLTGGYQKVADEEKGTANRWRLIALCAFLLAGVANAIILWVELDFGTDFRTLMATRLSVSIPLLALSAYAVAEASHHRRREQQNRQMELQLSSIDPYLALLPEETQHSIKADRVDRFFPGFPGRRADDLGAG